MLLLEHALGSVAASRSVFALMVVVEDAVFFVLPQ
jgi:hypothetical protein